MREITSTKDKINMIILINTQKSIHQNSTYIYYKNSHIPFLWCLFLVLVSGWWWLHNMNWNISQNNKKYLWKTTANIIFLSRKMKIFLLNSGTMMHSLTTSIQHSIGNPSQNNQTRKGNKRDPNWKKRGKTVTICRWYDTLYIEP